MNQAIMKNRLTILVCDDLKEHLDIVVNTFSKQHDIIVAIDGATAIKILEHNKADLVLLDVMMPGMDGYEVCRLIRKTEGMKEIPIIFVSEKSSLEDKKKGFALGAVDYITKPFDVGELEARVQTHISLIQDRHQVKNQNKYLLNEVFEKDILLERTQKEIEFAHLETIERLSRAAEYKDDETGLHVKRVGMISATISKNMGLPGQLIHALEHAAPLHDIGKIGIPESILLKPGKLDAHEWEIMKKHTVIGKEILKGSTSTIINIAEIIAFTHHEKWNGLGYPLGLKGEQIPRVSRIVAIADVVDALLSVRPYKKALTWDAAIEIVISEKGLQFDPHIVDVFLASCTEIKEELSKLGWIFI